VLSSPTTGAAGALKVANTNGSTPGRAISGTAASGGVGVWASGGDASKNTAAIHGQSGSGNAVEGISGATVASGVYGQNTSGAGYGVAGRAGSGGVAVYGDNTGTGFAGYFDNKVFVGGDLVCGGCVGDSDISASYVQGGGRALGQAAAIPPGSHLFLGPPLAGFLRLSYACPATLSNNGALVVYNDSGSLANVFVDSGGGNPNYFQMAAGDSHQFPASATGDSYFIQAQGALGIETIQAATVNRASDCHAQAQALLTQ
jgi:hypothetical protein